MNEELKRLVISELRDHKLLSVRRRLRDNDRNDVIDTVIKEARALWRNDSDADSDVADNIIIALTHSGVHPLEIIERAGQ